MKWIPVDYKLPEKQYKKYFVWLKDESPGIDFINANYEWVNFGEAVTDWCEIEPPMKEKETINKP